MRIKQQGITELVLQALVLGIAEPGLLVRQLAQASGLAHPRGDHRLADAVHLLLGRELERPHRLPRRDREVPGGVLAAHLLDDFRGRADPRQAGVDDGPGEAGVLREEAVARMDRIRAAGFEGQATPLEEGVRRYVQDFLSTTDPYR